MLILLFKNCLFATMHVAFISLQVTSHGCPGTPNTQEAEMDSNCSLNKTLNMNLYNYCMIDSSFTSI